MPTPLGRAEDLFGVQRAEVGDDGSFRQTMRTGAWMLDSDGMFCAGSLAVLADNILANAVFGSRPGGHWSVTTELSLDVVHRPSCDGSLLRAESWPVYLESGGGLAQGHIIDSSHRPIATGTARLRHTAAPAGIAGDRDRLADSLPPAKPEVIPSSTLAALGAEVRRVDQFWELVLPSDPALANPLGNVHGGILLCASEITGALSLRAQGDPLLTSSLRITYGRPARATGAVTFTSEVQYRGRTLGVAKVTGRDETGRTCTVATITGHNPIVVSHGVSERRPAARSTN